MLLFAFVTVAADENPLKIKETKIIEIPNKIICFLIIYPPPHYLNQILK